LAVGFTISACTPPDTPIVDGPETAEPAPTPTPTIEPASVPLPVLDIECADLASAATIAGTFPVAVAATDPSNSIMDAYPVIPKTYHLRSLGGLACEWNNGESQSSSTGTNPDYVGVQVLVLPDAETQWAKYEDYYGDSGAIGTYCSPGSSPITCTTNQLVGTNWVEVSVSAPSSEARAISLSSEILAAVGSAGPGADAWIVPADFATLPSECTDIISDADAQAAFALDVPIQATPPAGGWSLPSAASQNWGGPYCSWLYLDADAGVGSLNTLRGGAWAWDEARAFITVPSVPEPVAIAGLAATDEAWIRCAPADTSCLVDLVIGGNWISVDVWAEDGYGSPLGVDRRTAAIALAEAIVATL
jgi:hypothetical protein